MSGYSDPGFDTLALHAGAVRALDFAPYTFGRYALVRAPIAALKSSVRISSGTGCFSTETRAATALSPSTAARAYETACSRDSVCQIVL